ncbi:MAG TPA: hypothetical protein VJ697_04895 [Nitrososphaeraceae archaeon]|nr:hypothetical protein [Nitrososphaeraceae archaeon]
MREGETLEQNIEISTIHKFLFVYIEIIMSSEQIDQLKKEIQRRINDEGEKFLHISIPY